MELGLEHLDLQHHYFLNLILDLRKNVISSEDISLRYKLSALYAYARFHFISEENLMEECGFPNIEERHKMHGELIGKLHEVERLLTSSKSDANIEKFQHFLEAWFF